MNLINSSQLSAQTQQLLQAQLTERDPLLRQMLREKIPDFRPKPVEKMVMTESNMQSILHIVKLRKYLMKTPQKFSSNKWQQGWRSIIDSHACFSYGRKMTDTNITLDKLTLRGILNEIDDQLLMYGRFADDDSSQRNRICSWCGAKSKHLQKCSGCKREYYCDSVCQEAAWEQHKPNCGIFHPDLPKRAKD